MLPLEGITVVALEHAVAAPLCTRHLADLGARVIKVERPGVGDFARDYDQRVNGMASYFAWLNRSKESLCLDLKHPEAKKILNALIKKSDVLVQNLAPGASTRLGFSYEDLKQTHPHLIVCDISGYGDSGPYRDKKAYDLLIQSETGFLSITGDDGHPAKAGISIADISAGMYAYSSILAAILAREKNGGVGCRLDVALMETMTEWMSHPLYYSYDGAQPPRRSGAAHATIQPYGPFRVGDGKVVMLGLQNEREWGKFCSEVLNRTGLATDPRFDTNAKRVDSRGLLLEIITGVLSELNSDELVQRLDKAGIANARMNEMHEVWEHEQLKARERWAVVDSPVGPIPALKPPALPKHMQSPMRAIPAVGEHTAAILAELGCESGQINELRRTGVI